MMSLPAAVVSCPSNMNVSTSARISSSLNPLPSSSYIITVTLIIEIKSFIIFCVCVRVCVCVSQTAMDKNIFIALMGWALLMH